MPMRRACSLLILDVATIHRRHRLRIDQSCSLPTPFQANCCPLHLDLHRHLRHRDQEQIVLPALFRLCSVVKQKALMLKLTALAHSHCQSQSYDLQTPISQDSTFFAS